jgi:hypothetical protein
VSSAKIYSKLFFTFMAFVRDSPSLHQLVKFMQDADRKRDHLIPALGSHTASHEVTEADEEIFLLYTLSAPEADRRGLGQVDNKNDLILVTIDLADPNAPIDVCPIDRDNLLMSKERSPAKGKAPKATLKTTLSVTIRQDSTSLRSTGGDTGSVIWRSSLYLAEKIIRDLSEITSGRRRHPSEQIAQLLSPIELAKCRVLELGSGTGILPLLLLAHPYLAKPDLGLKWLATDQPSMLSLLQKNLALSSAHVAALDWVEASMVYHSNSESIKLSFLRNLMEPFGGSKNQDAKIADLIIATDCIFNPSLFGPFVDTLNLCSAPQKTIVMVVCELREPEAMTEFLQSWLNVGKRGEQWSIHALEGEAVLGKGLLRGSVVWVGWRV